ncbi:protein ANTAGONIST OF LIKE HETEROCHROMATIN PROTEIN 1-like, partial [Temnothorax curvispinosus]|uniref:Protein ANTAGONIST OF LIKE HETEROCHROMATIN PROTEIN 1-like n=1 Tax=Temnothorax curvispinosus TaxID=300111 RepID=A0A6J1Q7N9_9HYME
MSATHFEVLVQLVGPSIERTRETIARRPISVGERLALTLRYVVSGDSMVSLSYQFRMGKSTVSNIIFETCTALWSKLRASVLELPTTEDWKEIGRGFESQWNFPNCIGAIDGKHIPIQAPAGAGSEYYNYKGFHSIVLLAICDYRYAFTMLDIGATGRQSDG